MSTSTTFATNAAPAVLMVRPANFGPNPETARSNAFQASAEANELDEIRSTAIAEFDAAVELLKKEGVDVVAAQDEYLEQRKDAIFPNNWVSFHPSGLAFLYPMHSPARRTERRKDVLDKVSERFSLSQIIDISHSEEYEKYLEGTGSLIFDYPHRVVYAARSVRTHEELVRAHAAQVGFNPVIFNAFDKAGTPIYHTNVLMCVGSGYSVICLECVSDGPEKNTLLQTHIDTGLEIVEISFAQLAKYAGNMLEVALRQGGTALVMSSAAFESLTLGQKNTLRKYTKLVAVNIPTIERYGGGSARCMMAGVYLPQK